jgi:hypothetical protein
MQALTTTTTAQQEQQIQVVAVVVQTLTLRLLRLVDQVLLFFVTLAYNEELAVL